MSDGWNEDDSINYMYTLHRYSTNLHLYLHLSLVGTLSTCLGSQPN